MKESSIHATIPFPATVIMESEQPKECLLLNGTFDKRFPTNTYIDRGCSGTVYRVTDNVDEKDYAVKKIIIGQNENEILQNVFRKSQKEVVRLARAGDHINIVSYVTAWFEETPGPQQETSTVESSSDQLSSPTGILQDAQLVSSSSLISSTATTDSSMSISSAESASNRDRAVNRVNIMLRSDSRPAYTLFIQMELCTTSLREWLNERKTLLGDHSYEPKFSQLRRWVNPTYGEEKYLFELVANPETDNCLEGIVRGLNHMHTKGYAHRDLHLKNILMLVNKQGVVIPKLSDFGSAKTLERLSCQLADIQLNTPPDVGCQLSQGTMSNESIETDSNSFARESKDDMQHLAEVILQLYYPDGLRKDVEELLNEHNWASGEVAEYQPFVKRFKHQARWIQELKTEEYESRPTAVQILRNGKKHNIFKGKELEEDILKAENKRLSDENLEKDREIKRLRLQLGVKTPSPARNGSSSNTPFN